jgi:phosphatidylserine/phosphatidylglycerophosphate/cardiolipin synthase-like enzyme
MTEICAVGVRGGAARLVSDEAYLPELRALVDNARLTCLCSVFIVDLSPRRSGRLLVDALLGDLASARWRGVDARLLIGGSRDNIEIAETADLARARALSLGVPTRWATSRPVRGTHAKLVLVDDYVLTGSHNWSIGAFSDQTQDSVLVSSKDLALYLGAEFERAWAGAA